MRSINDTLLCIVVFYTAEPSRKHAVATVVKLCNLYSYAFDRMFSLSWEWSYLIEGVVKNFTEVHYALKHSFLKVHLTFMVEERGWYLWQPHPHVIARWGINRYVKVTLGKQANNKIFAFQHKRFSQTYHTLLHLVLSDFVFENLIIVCYGKPSCSSNELQSMSFMQVTEKCSRCEIQFGQISQQNWNSLLSYRFGFFNRFAINSKVFQFS